MTSKQSLLLLILYSLFIVYGTTIPFDLSNMDGVIEKLFSVSLNPFFNSDGSRVSFSDVIQNVMLFIPLGLFGGVWVKRKKISSVSGIIIITSYGMFLSISVEIIQLFSLSRTTSLNDLITNTTGTIIGLICCTFAIKEIDRVRNIRVVQELEQVPSFYSFLMTLVVIVVEVLQPFDFAIDPSMTYAKIKDIIANPLEFSLSLRDDMWVATLYLTVGLLSAKVVFAATSQLVKNGIIILTLLFPILLEMAQFIISSRSPQSGDILLAISGIIGGMFFFRLIPLKTISGLLLLIPLYLGSVVCKLWYPFKINSNHTPMNLVPFSAEYANTTMTSLGNSFETLVLFSFGGYLAAALIQNNKLRVTILLTSGMVIISCILEYTQGWVVGRYPDISDVITSTFAFFLGWIVYRNKVNIKSLD